MNSLLTIKHWQLFLLLVAVPIIIHLSFSGYFFATIIQAGEEPEPQDILPFMGYVPFIFGIIILLNVTWQYTLGTNLHKKLPATAKMNLNLYKVFLAVPFVYIVILSLFILQLIKGIETNDLSALIWLAAVVPMHFFTIFCLFYCIYFNAKSLKTVEMQREVTFGDYIGEFFLFWFLPVGIWFLQPRINKIFDETAYRETKIQY